MDTLDHITAAVRQCEIYGESEAMNYFHRQMSAADRLRFDGFLVKTRDPLAYEPGTCEGRFRTRVIRMLRLKQTGQLSEFRA